MSELIESLEARMLLAGTGVGGVPQPDHVVIVVEENHSYQSLFGTGGSSLPGGLRPPKIPFIQSLAKNGALFTDSKGITHPSQPNYLALFSGSTQHVTDDSYVTPNLGGPDLGGELIAAGKTFTGYAEGLKRAGFTGDKSGGYRKKHNPWVDFTDVPAADNQPLTAFPQDFSQLPTVSFVIPTDANNMHSGSPPAADKWLKKHLGTYAAWAQTHNSLLIVTWDEDDKSSGNQIPTIFYGPMVKPGQYAEHITHYSVLRTLQDMYGLGYAGASASATSVTDVWG
jgi:phosphatidylinositol-3-phosphatase